MPTLYSSIFAKANSKFDDAQLLANLTDEELTELLEIFLDESKSVYFKSCKKDLSDVNDTLKQFNEDLTSEEEWILALGIRLVWLERKLFKEENLRNRITPKDYNSFSGGNLIDKLTILKDKTEKDLRQKVIDYTFNLFEGFN
jgi:hypothetical protein